MSRGAEHVIGSAGAGVFTPAGFADALAKFGDSIRPAIVRALKKVGEVPKRYAVEGFVSRGVGKGIFGRNARGAYSIIRVGAVETKGSTFVLALELRGFAALQEQGGHTKAHLIVPRRKKALRLKSTNPGGGGSVFTRASAVREAFSPSVSTTFLRRGATARVASDLGAFRFAVDHPGSVIPRHPFAAEAMRGAAPQIQAAIDNAIVQAGTGIGVRSSGLVKEAA